MDLDPPTYDEPPDTEVTDVTFTLSRVTKTTWQVRCRAWRFEHYTTNPTKALAMVMADIEDHNEEIAKEAAEAAKEAKPARRHSPIPDDGRMTPGRSLY